MRRKQKRGIYSNQTIKFCPVCEIICSCCKSVCKFECGFSSDDLSISKNHLAVPDNMKRKLHQKGVGSLKMGRKFICYSRRNHKHSKISDKEYNSQYFDKNRFFKYDISDQISQFNRINEE